VQINNYETYCKVYKNKELLRRINILRGLVFLGNKKAELREFSDPEPDINEVVVKIKVSALCGSDLHFYRSESQYLNLGVISGHEPSGIVHKIGKCVKNVKIGDRVSVHHYISCGNCRHCLAGNKMFCEERLGLGWKAHGANADYLLINAENCLKLPDELSYIDGAFIACIAGTTFSALKKLNPSGKDTLAIFGLGPVGLTAGLIAKAMGTRIIGLEIDEKRIALAKNIGIEKVINVAKNNCVEELKRLTNRMGPNKIIETSGNLDAQKNAVEAASIQGEIALIGLSGVVGPSAKTSMGVDPAKIIFKELKIMGSFVMPVGYYYELSDFINVNKINFEQIVTHRFPLEKANEALEIFDKGGTGKVIFEF